MRHRLDQRLDRHEQRRYRGDAQPQARRDACSRVARPPRALIENDSVTRDDQDVTNIRNIESRTTARMIVHRRAQSRRSEDGCDDSVSTGDGCVTRVSFATPSEPSRRRLMKLLVGIRRQIQRHGACICIGVDTTRSPNAQEATMRSSTPAAPTRIQGMKHPRTPRKQSAPAATTDPDADKPGKRLSHWTDCEAECRRLQQMFDFAASR